MIAFYVQCSTSFGQNLFISVGDKVYAMIYVVNGLWQFVMENEHSTPTHYHYFIQNPDMSVIEESPKQRLLPKFEESLKVYDTFQDRSISSVFRTTPFIDVLCYHTPVKIPALKVNHCLLVVNAPAVEPHQGVAVIGNHRTLGAWQTTDLVPMNPAAEANWFLVLTTDTTLQGVEYKFVIYNLTDKTIVRWEEGENRRLPEMEESTLLSQVFRQTYTWKGAGVAIPVFSLRAQNDWGVGEFYDLKQMVDWAHQTGQKLIQILPINDTTNKKTDADSYPYSANSVYALHPMYLNLLAVGPLTDSSLMAQFEQERQVLNAKSFVDYASVNALKWKYITLIYEQTAQTLFATKAYKDFYKNNESWLLPYAVFSTLRDRYATSDFRQWSSLAVYDEKEVQQFAKKNRHTVAIHYFVQYHLAKQLTEVRQYAHSQGVIFKGDLPIGISPDSVDAWMYPRLFHLDKQAGAPPDDFSVTGQNWGFPTYNWTEMAKNHYAWWKNRFQNMANYFDAYRIDHILGFFRIWEIPKTAVWGLLGYFNPALPLSVDEIKSYGVDFEPYRCLMPCITQELLNQLFGSEMERVAAQFFDVVTFDRYQFKPAFDTQQKLQQFFERQALLPEQKQILNGLLELHTEVLFIEDPVAKGLYHPRISVQKSYTFRALNDTQKRALSALYEDFYYHRHTDFWRQQAMNKLPALLSTTNMLVCGEDLGMVPASVPEVMHALQILSLEIQRMPKNPAVEFVIPSDTPYLSVCSTGTHDTSPLRSWWTENKEATQRYYNEVLHVAGQAPDTCTPEIAEKIICQQLASQGMLVILPLQDYLATDGQLRFCQSDAERINDPSNPHHFWSYRLHLSLSQLLEATAFNAKLKQFISNR